MVAATSNVGLFGYAAGRDVWVVDRLGLGDPVAARLFLYTRSRPGHEKLLLAPWVYARFADPHATADPATQQARRALSCRPWWWNGGGVFRAGQLPDTLRAISAPLTVGRFLANVKFAATSDKLRVNGDPFVAASDLCGPF
jgi:hypothetical protein